MNYDRSKKFHKYSSTCETIVFKKLSDFTFFVNSPCFLTVPSKTIQINGIYLKAEGSHFDTIKILNVHFKDGFIYLLIEDLKTGRIYQISHIVGDNYPCIWWLLSWDYFEQEMVKRIKRKIFDDVFFELEF
jgi:hypothetical protein